MSGQSDGADGAAREPTRLSGAVVAPLAQYVERVMGAAAVAHVAASVGRPPDDLALGAEWWTRDEAVALYDAAAAICHDDDIGRRVGEEIVRGLLLSGMASLYRSGTLADSLPVLVNYGTRMCTDRVLRVDEVTEGRAVIEARFGDAADAHRHFCGVVAGSYVMMPAIFGGLGAVVEETCQARGDDVCRFRVVWDVVNADEAATAPSLVEPTNSSEVLLRRFEQLQEMASDLAEAEDLATVLPRILDLGNIAVTNAPRHLLAVRLDNQLHLHHRGFVGDEAARLADRLLAGQQPAANEVAVPVASPRGSYGVLAAVYPRGAHANDVDRRLLMAYARHAAAALEAAQALETARRDRDTATALLGLARALADVASQEDVVSKLVDVVPAVIGCDAVWVWRWEEESSSLRLAAMSADGAGVENVLDARNVPGLGEMAADPQPMIIRLADADPVIRRHLEAAGVTWTAVVPIAARGDFLGVVSAGFARDDSEEETALLDRLRGLAGQAASALDSARLLDRIRHQALHDPLTGLPNRPLVEDRAERALRLSERDGYHVAVLFIDLDRFKVVNDTLGHALGDRLIVLVAERLAACVRASDTLARLGGDEFVVLLPASGGVVDATAAARRVIDALRAPFELDGRRLFVSCSIGIAVAPQHGTTYGELLQHADAAMYEAKAEGRNTYESRVTRSESSRTALDIETQLHLAVEREELALLYQPQVDLASMRIVGVEALLRWDHPEMGRLAPDAFLPIAEESGVIVELDRWVRETAVRQAARWVAAGMPLRMAVNVSSRDLRRPSLPAEIAELLGSHALDPSFLEVEITDRVVIADEPLAQALDDLHSLGVRLAIDDFGTGTSVLGRLHRCPVDTLKIDKSFTQAITPASPDAPVMTALFSLGQSLQMEILAEGIETAFQSGVLRRLGCHLAQGFFFSPPVDAEAVDALLVETRLVTVPD